MTNVKYNLLYKGKANKGKINEINRLINRAIRCIYLKKRKENVSKMKLTKKILDIENMLNYDLGIIGHKFKRDILPVNFKPYFTNINKIHNHLTTILELTIIPECIIFMVSSHYPILVVNYGKNCLEI